MLNCCCQLAGTAACLSCPEYQRHFGLLGETPYYVPVYPPFPKLNIRESLKETIGMLKGKAQYDTTKEYQVKYTCTNCHNVLNKFYKKGERAPENADCDYCGCEGTAKKNLFTESALQGKKILCD